MKRFIPRCSIVCALLLAGLPCLAAGEAKAVPLYLAVTLDDGSRLLGVTELAGMRLESDSLGATEVLLRNVRAIDFEHTPGKARIVFQNGEILTGTLELAKIQLSTSLGKLAIPGARIVRIERTRMAGLVAYYPFTGNADDVSGRGNNATVHYAVLAKDRFGPEGHAYYFNGDGAYIDCGAGKSMQVGGPDSSFSISSWIKRTSDNKFHQIVGMGWGEDNRAVAFGLSGRNLPYFNFHGNALVPDKPYSDVGAWHHWIVAYDGVANARRIYRDGALIGGDKSPEDFLGSGRVYIGRPPWDGATFHGSIDTVRIFNRALCELEIGQLHAMEKEYEDPGRWPEDPERRSEYPLSRGQRRAPVS